MRKTPDDRFKEPRTTLSGTKVQIPKALLRDLLYGYNSTVRYKSTNTESLTKRLKALLRDLLRDLLLRVQQHKKLMQTAARNSLWYKSTNTENKYRKPYSETCVTGTTAQSGTKVQILKALLRD
jgi:hypothetical protein